MSGRLFLPLFVAGSILGLFTPVPDEYAVVLLALGSVLVVLAAIMRYVLARVEYAGVFFCLEAILAVTMFLLGLANSGRCVPEKGVFFRDSSFVSTVAMSMDEFVDTFFFNTSSAGGRGLLKALVLGNKGELDAAVKSDFRKSGASHILALSGMHIGVIYSALIFLLAPLNLTYGLKRAKLPLALCAMILYVIVTGLSPSSCRAVLMIGMNLWSRERGRAGYIETPLFLSASILLIIDPYAVKSLSFQLSFAAMAGIVFIYPALNSAFDNFFHDTGAVGKTFTNQESLKLFTRVRLHRLNPAVALILWLLRSVYQLCAISISCQITTAPLVLCHFGSLPQHFLITNIIVSPIVSLIICSFIISGFVYLLSLCVAAFSCLCVDFFASLLHFMSTFTGMLLNTLISVVEWLAV